MGVDRIERRAWLGITALLIGAFLVVGLVPARLDAEASERVGEIGAETTASRPLPELRDDLLALTNSDRATHGLTELRLAERLSRYATRHSRRMADLGYLFHSGDEQLREALGGSGWEVAGENVGVGGSLEELEDAFMGSAPHRHNVLGRPYDRAAVGIVESDGTLWVTVIFYSG